MNFIFAQVDRNTNEPRLFVLLILEHRRRLYPFENHFLYHVLGISPVPKIMQGYTGYDILIPIQNPFYLTDVKWDSDKSSPLSHIKQITKAFSSTILKKS